MDEQKYLGFISALGEAYCEVVDPQNKLGSDPHDGFEVFAKMFGMYEITPEKLHAAHISNSQLAELRDIACKWHETDQIQVDQIREVLRRVLWRWPPASS